MMQVKHPLLFTAVLLLFCFSATGQNRTADGISYVVLSEGSGNRPQIGHEVKCHYVVSDANGNVLWSTRKNIDAPDFITLGQAKSEMGRVRDNCFALMPRGSRYRFEFPKAMMDSEKAADLPGDYITYDIEVLDFATPKPSGVALFREIRREEGLSAALDKLQALCDARSQSYALREPDINRLGYELLSAGEKDAAIAVFRMNISLNPNSFNAYDSLGDAYLAKGEKAQAKASFERALQINPQFEAAREKLQNL